METRKLTCARPLDPGDHRPLPSGALRRPANRRRRNLPSSKTNSPFLSLASGHSGRGMGASLTNLSTEKGRDLRTELFILSQECHHYCLLLEREVRFHCGRSLAFNASSKRLTNNKSASPLFHFPIQFFSPKSDLRYAGFNLFSWTLKRQKIIASRSKATNGAN